MRRFLLLGITGVLGALTAVAIWASHVGAGIPKPEKNPPSIREGSQSGPLTRGHHRTRFFVGGGLRGGK